jgi:hypothetical protein
VIEDQPHSTPTPLLGLAAQLADALLEACLVEAPLEMVAAVGRPLHKNLIERNGLSPRRRPRGVRVEVIDRDLPHFCYIAA